VTVRQDFIAYQESITNELRAVQDRVRNLIGPSHWQTDGEHKETILRRVLRTHLPESVRVGKGFVCYPHSRPHTSGSAKRSSRQLDILITSRNKPTLYKEQELVFVTADTVEAIIEVKTRLRRNTARKVIRRLSEEAENIRKNAEQPQQCWAGLFIFETGDIDDVYLLETLQEVANGQRERVVNCIALGRDSFIRFWENGILVESLVAGPVWHSYELRNLAPTYFIGNIVFRLSPSIPDEAQIAWFPIEGTKETRRRYCIPLTGGDIQEF